MCGIVGYLGTRDAAEVVLGGLRKLEYRGYDSAGIALLDERTQPAALTIARAVGRVEALAAKVAALGAITHLAIGHTRWATHGRPSELNAHPHTDSSGRIAVVHNGIVENYTQLRDELAGGGAVFTSQTDTEVAAKLIGTLYQGDLIEAVERAIELPSKATFAFAVANFAGSSRADRRRAARFAAGGRAGRKRRRAARQRRHSADSLHAPHCVSRRRPGAGAAAQPTARPRKWTRSHARDSGHHVERRRDRARRVCALHAQGNPRAARRAAAAGVQSCRASRFGKSCRTRGAGLQP